MNIAIIDADSIYWAADKAIRLVDFDYVINTACNVCEQDKIYIIGGFEQTDPFSEAILTSVKRSGKEVETISSRNPLDGKASSSVVLLDFLVKSVITQDEPGQNKFTIVTADASAINTVTFMEENGLMKGTSFILGDNIDLKQATSKVNVYSTIPLKEDERTVIDNLVIGEVLKLIKSDSEKENPFYNTMSILAAKCENYSNIPPISTRLMVNSLIHHRYLERQRFTNNAGDEKIGIILGPKAKDLFDNPEDEQESTTETES